MPFLTLVVSATYTLYNMVTMNMTIAIAPPPSWYLLLCELLIKCNF